MKRFKWSSVLSAGFKSEAAPQGQAIGQRRIAYATC